MRDARRLNDMETSIRPVAAADPTVASAFCRGRTRSVSGFSRHLLPYGNLDDACRVDLHRDAIARACVVDARRDRVQLDPVVAAHAKPHDGAVPLGADHERVVAGDDAHGLRARHGRAVAVRDDVPHPEEPRDPVVRRLRPELVRRRDLGDPALAKHCHPVADRERLADVVRHVDDSE